MIIEFSDNNYIQENNVASPSAGRRESMNIEQYVFNRIKRLVPEMTDLRFRASISENTYSVEFSVTQNGVKRQCYDMVDDGLLDASDLKRCQKDIVNFIRKSDSFIPGKINKYSFSISKHEKRKLFKTKREK